MGNFHKALNDINVAIEKNPEKVNLYHDRGGIYRALNNYSEALNNFSKAISINNNYIDSYLDRAYIYFLLNDTSKAKIDCDSVLKLQDYSDPWTYYRMGIMSMQSNPTQSLEYFNKAISSEPYDHNIYIKRGIVYKSQMNYQKALLDFNKSIEITPSIEAYKQRSDVLLELNQLNKTILDYNEWIKLDKNNPEIYYYLANIYSKQSKYTKSIEMYTISILKAKEFNYNDLDPEIKLSDIYIARGNVFSEMQKTTTSMCEDYKRACDLGDCHMYEENCK